MNKEVSNRKTVLIYFDMVFTRHDPANAAEKYLDANYVHHGSGCGKGKNEFILYFTQYFLDHPLFHAEVTHCIAENEFVALRIATRVTPLSEPQMVAEFYRLEDNKIVEHWHVLGLKEE